jgi:ubiquinone/menaquinone biosynthesis C-methylase UbiE
LPVDDGSAGVAVQNCLFKIFEAPELRQALAEMHRVLRPRGRLVLPLAVCDKTAARLSALGRPDLLVTGPTWFYDGGGCC